MSWMKLVMIELSNGLLSTHRKLKYFSITLRMQRLFMSLKTIEHLTWHQSHDAVNIVMVHSFNGEAWKQFNNVHPQFLVKTRKVHLWLYTDGFNLFWSFAPLYFYWLVILMIYKLPSKMCMRPDFIFLSTVIPKPNSLGWNIDFYLQPLIDELKQLWSSRALTYDISRKYNFLMKVALM